MDRTRAAANSAREKYVQQILKTRARRTNRIGRIRRAFQEDEEAKSRSSRSGTPPLEHVRSRSSPHAPFQAELKQLAGLEKTVISEKIPLRREGNSYYASVVVNADHVVDMVVDTGASSLVLPYKTAMECGVKIDASAMAVQMIVASGAKFKSKLVTLDSVRASENAPRRKVECVVLPPEATNAPILLGMTFLGRFNFSINGTELVLSRGRRQSVPFPSDPKRLLPVSPRKSRLVHQGTRRGRVISSEWQPSGGGFSQRNGLAADFAGR